MTDKITVNERAKIKKPRKKQQQTSNKQEESAVITKIKQVHPNPILSHSLLVPWPLNVTVN